MDNKEVEQFLTRKMKFGRSEGTKYTHFNYLAPDGLTVFPKITSLVRSSGEFTVRNLGNTAEALGVTEKELKTAISCRLSRECILVCLSIRLTIDFHLNKVEEDPVAYPQDIQQCFARAMESMLTDVRRCRPSTWKKQETTALARVKERLKPVSESRFEVLRECAASIVSVIGFTPLGRTRHVVAQAGLGQRPDFMIPEALLGLLRRRQCVAFVGAGFSMSCGMPNWNQLLWNLLRYARSANANPALIATFSACEQAIQAGKYTMAFDLLRDLMTPGELDESVRQQFGHHVFYQASESDQERTRRRMANLIRAPWAGIVTTNYDELIENAISEWSRADVIKAYGDEPRLGTILANSAAGGVFFVKVHGSISGSRIVLGTEEYDRVYLGTPRMTAFLTALMLRYHLVFIGCSLEDELLRLRRMLREQFQGIIPVSYAVLQDNALNRSRRSWLRDLALIECLSYPEADQEHSAVDYLLAVAANCATTGDKKGT